MELVSQEMGTGNGSLRQTDHKFVSVVDVNGGSAGLVGTNEDDEEDFWAQINGHENNCIENGGVTVIRVRDDSEDDPRHKLMRTRSGSSDNWSGVEAETDYIVNFLGKSTDHAEARLAAKRQARAEAREIRMRELERQQKEAEETADKIYDMYSSDGGTTRSSRVNASVNSGRGISLNNSYHSSRRSSEDSLEETASLRDVRHELREVEDKFRKAMIGNAQLDNEKAAAAYQVELYKDKYEELEEAHSQLQREHKEKCRQLEQMKRDVTKLQQDLEMTVAALEERDRLIQEQGLVIVGGDTSSSGDESDSSTGKKGKHKRALVSADMAALLDSVGHGSLDVRLKRLAAERNELQDELRHVKLELEEERARGNRIGNSSGDLQDIQREVNKQLGDYKFKLQKAEQDVSTLQANVARLESQVVRYKTAAETAEKMEDELKSERRKLQREVSNSPEA